MRISPHSPGQGLFTICFVHGIVSLFNCVFILSLALCFIYHNPVAQHSFLVLKVVKHQEISCTVTETERGRYVGVSNTSYHKRAQCKPLPKCCGSPVFVHASFIVSHKG